MREEIGSRRAWRWLRSGMLVLFVVAGCDGEAEDRAEQDGAEAGGRSEQVEPAAVEAPVALACAVAGGEAGRVFRPECSPAWTDGRADTSADASRALAQAVARARATGGIVLLQPGATYRYSSDWMMEGGGVHRSDPRPITVDGQGAVLETRAHVQLFIGTGDTFRRLEIRGPHFGRTGFPRVLGAQGINGSSQDRWTLDDVRVHGFADNGVLASDTRGVTIRDCHVSHNGATAIALFTNGSATTVTGCTLTDNGQDGVDTNHSRLRLIGNVASRNGWRGDGGDRSGFLIVGGTDILIEGNRADANGEHGIYIHGPVIPVGTVVIRDNETVGNARYGISFYGTVARADLQDNRASGNRAGCWNLPHPGVRSARNTCR